MKKLLLLLSIISGAADMAAAQRVLQFAKKVPWVGIGASSMGYYADTMNRPGSSFFENRKNFKELSDNPKLSENGKYLFLSTYKVDEFVSKNNEETAFAIINKDTQQKIICINDQLYHALVNTKESNLNPDVIKLEQNIALMIIGHEKAHHNFDDTKHSLTNPFHLYQLLQFPLPATIWYLTKFKFGILPSIFTTISTLIGITYKKTQCSYKREKRADLYASDNPEILRAGAKHAEISYQIFKNNNIAEETTLFGQRQLLIDLQHPHPLERARYLEEKAAQLEAEQQKENK